MIQPSEAGGGQSGSGQPGGSGGSRRRRRGGRGRGSGSRQGQSQAQGQGQPKPQAQAQAQAQAKGQGGQGSRQGAAKAPGKGGGQRASSAKSKGQAQTRGRGQGGGGAAAPQGGGGRTRHPAAGARGGADAAAATRAPDGADAGGTVLEDARADLLRDQRAAAHRAHRRARLIAAAPGLVVFVVVGAVLAAAVSPVVGLVAGVVAGFLWWAFTLREARRVVLRAMKAQDLDVEGMARLENLVEGLCATMGLAPPEVLAVDDPSRNAIVVGRTPGDAALVVTTGLLASLDPVALEGVLAHELTHIKNGDIAPATVAAAVLLPVAAITPSVGATVHRWAGLGREFRADADAVRVTRYPPGLRDALAAMAQGPAPRPPSPLADGALARATRWLWAVALPGPAAAKADGAAEVGELDAPSARIAALDEW